MTRGTCSRRSPASRTTSARSAVTHWCVSPSSLKDRRRSAPRSWSPSSRRTRTRWPRTMCCRPTARSRRPAWQASWWGCAARWPCRSTSWGPRKTSTRASGAAWSPTLWRALPGCSARCTSRTAPSRWTDSSTASRSPQTRSESRWTGSPSTRRPRWPSWASPNGGPASAGAASSSGAGRGLLSRWWACTAASPARASRQSCRARRAPNYHAASCPGRRLRAPSRRYPRTSSARRRAFPACTLTYPSSPSRPTRTMPTLTAPPTPPPRACWRASTVPSQCSTASVPASPPWAISPSTWAPGRRS
mmetsp:Transcript_13268/g.55626  ORF Transcript_13268/g.55626 Transcript_13268/m.55626 type:complete len:304 (-) Transcript_13268:1102-2013(-)